MNLDINVPEPWIANLCYNDGSRSYDLYMKQKGDTWAVKAEVCIGHAHMPEAELRQKAEKRAQEYIQRGF